MVVAQQPFGLSPPLPPPPALPLSTKRPEISVRIHAKLPRYAQPRAQANAGARPFLRPMTGNNSEATLSLIYRRRSPPSPQSGLESVRAGVAGSDGALSPPPPPPNRRFRFRCCRILAGYRLVTRPAFIRAVIYNRGGGSGCIRQVVFRPELGIVSINVKPKRRAMAPGHPGPSFLSARISSGRETERERETSLMTLARDFAQTRLH